PDFKVVAVSRARPSFPLGLYGSYTNFQSDPPGVPTARCVTTCFSMTCVRTSPLPALVHQASRVTIDGGGNITADSLGLVTGFTLVPPGQQVPGPIAGAALPRLIFATRGLLRSSRP